MNLEIGDSFVIKNCPDFWFLFQKHCCTLKYTQGILRKYYRHSTISIFLEYIIRLLHVYIMHIIRWQVKIYRFAFSTADIRWPKSYWSDALS